MTIHRPESFRAVDWKDDALVLLDQRELPRQEIYRSYTDAGEVAAAIRCMVVRGAPAIGIAAAYGYVLAVRAACAAAPTHWRSHLRPQIERLAASRPTAVNLAWALARMDRAAERVEGPPEAALLAEAIAIHEEDVAANRRMGEIGAAYIGSGAVVLTHCNAGALATGGYGTALGVVRAASARGSIAAVYADETRPWLQGARLTAWECDRLGIAHTLVADVMAATLMRQGRVDLVIVGADRITADGAVANKVGTYQVAVAAAHHGVPFYVAAPLSSFDPGTATGDDIDIEQRGGDEVTDWGGRRIAPVGTQARNDAFDVTPGALVTAYVTEEGIRPGGRGG